METRLCSVSNCNSTKLKAKGLCGKHYQQKWMGKSFDQPRSNAARYTMGANGYMTKIIFTPEGKKKRLSEHREIMAEMIGRPLVPGEEVHHLNGVRHDNRPENLELWSTSYPKGQRAIDKLKWAREIIALYQDTYTETGEES